MAFISNWTYERHVEHAGRVYHLWSCTHTEGYTAYQITCQPERRAGLAYVKPQGSGHYTSIEGLARKTGIPVLALRP